MLGINNTYEVPLTPRDLGSRGWPPFNPGNPLGLAQATAVLGDPLAFERYALTESLKRSPSVVRSGLGTAAPSGQLLAFTPHARRHPPVPHRSRELAWRASHEDVLRAFAGQWVVLEGEEIVVHGKDPVQLVAEAKGKGIGVPYIFFVESPGDNVVRIGL